MRRRPEAKPGAISIDLRRFALQAIAVSAVIMGMSSGSARSESLQEAISSAYLFNPTLKAARAQLRSTDEGVPLAKSGFRPTINGEILQTYQHFDTKPPSASEGDTDPRSYSVTLNQPLFRGFRTINAVKGAEALVEAGREDLRNSEQQVLLDAVTSYVDVVRDQAVLSLRQNNLRVLNEQLRAAEDRFQVGEVTRTDVAQAKARTSGASSAISAARANLQSSRATFAQIVGNAPGTLRDPGPARILPAALEPALQIGEGENPGVLAAIFRERAQDHVIKQVKGELLPSVDLQATYALGTGETGSVGGKREEVTTVTGVVTVPIYQGGSVSARIRQNIETRSQLRHVIDEARELARANIISAWGVLVAARAQIISDQAQVEANTVALSGVKEEEKVGQRTVLDVLNAEQELLNSQVDLATSRRNLVVASYSLLASIGRLSISGLGLPVEQYDPTQHYRQVKNKWIGWSTSVEESESEPIVLPVRAPGREAGQPSGDGPAYTQGLR